MAATLLFRGLPATGGVADYRTRQVLDGIIENLRASNLAVSATGQVYANGVTPATSSVENLGAGARVGVDFANDRLRLRTLVGSEAVTVTTNGNTIAVGITEGAALDTYKLKVNSDGSDTTPNFLYNKLVNAGGVATHPLLVHDNNVATAKLIVKSLKDGDGILFSEAANVITVSAQLTEGDGITITPDVDGSLIIAATAADHKVCIGPDPATFTEDVPGYLAAKLVDNATGAAVPVLGIDGFNGVLGVRGLLGGLGVAIAPDDPDDEGLGSIRFDFDPSGLAAQAFDNTQQEFAAYDATAVGAGNPAGAVRVTLEAPAGCPFATGDNAGTADTVARGDHTHATPFPDGAAGYVWYRDAEGWTAAPLATLVGDILAAMANVTPDNTWKFLVKNADGTVIGWGPLVNCQPT